MFYWDVGTGRTIRRYRGHDHAVNAVVFAAHDTIMVTAGYDQAVKVWDCRSNSINAVQTMKCFQDSVTCVQVETPRTLPNSLVVESPSRAVLFGNSETKWRPNGDNETMRQ